MRRILTSQYWVFSPNWIFHSNPPSHTITSLRPTPAGLDTATQSRYMWMVGISVTVCVCISLSVCDCTWLPLSSILLFPLDSIHHAVVLVWSASHLLSVSKCCCSKHVMTCRIKPPAVIDKANIFNAWLIESWAVLCCYGLLHHVIHKYSWRLT